MDAPALSADPRSAQEEDSHEVLWPREQSLPLVVASPHSGSNYPAAFVAASRLDPLALRRSEDSFVDEIFAAAPELGAPLIRALFPRAFVDPNREPFELDPSMFADRLPDYANTRSPRVAAGLGTIARVVANGADIYRDKLRFAQALQRIQDCYWPYHASLRELVEQTRAQFGYCLLLDCHSMPSSGGPLERDAGGLRFDIVLGDCHGTACGSAISEAAARFLARHGYRVSRNKPYSGGFVTRHYGRPEEGLHALQIEINRALYMDEERIARGPGLKTLAADMAALLEHLGETARETLARS
ncbi:N-formylglutamate amidohydrolase [Tistlia consotensis]|uniref:N-formylglutamate amidohydrolase n=1 Tax=Tistlia consotensis USBA 355 TaxID=560819 RepID=A0A1Y6C8G2_9PROT|nr:N-formylglutamate amidohydrolase [Tistlia consotensis]SMF51498.1 N-formylglutamate amidohydrolase [Tistlia consotensis USBA 355]SNR84160.1 N-formylglutamate amidohydrolase [Tistlia consotensis]